MKKLVVKQAYNRLLLQMFINTAQKQKGIDYWT